MIDVAILAVLLTAFLALLGWIGKRLYDKYRRLTDRLEEVEEKSDTMMTVMFGREIDENDEGFTDEVESGMEFLNEKLEDTEDDLDDVEDVVGVIVIRLDKHDDIDFDKEEVDGLAELEALN